MVEWHDLRDRAHRIERIEGGVAMTAGVELHDAVADLARREAACCTFLSLSLTRTDDEIRLEITSDNPDAAPVIDLITGAHAE